MTETTKALNDQWIEACKVMHIINERRKAVYLEWKSVMESEGTQFGDDFPLMQDIQPSINYDLYGNEISIE